jgi:hypothetical protein
MKVTLLFLLLLASIYAQQNGNYFPHAIGDAWQYRRDDGLRERYEVVKDSLLPDSSKWLQIKFTYVHLNASSLKWMYWISKNQDSVMRGGNLLYKFPMKPGDKWMRWDPLSSSGMMGHCWGKFTTNIFGKEVNGFYLRFYSKYDMNDTSTTFNTLSRKEELAEGFGKIWEGDEVEYYVLTGCIINGVKYGTITDVNNNSEIEKPLKYRLYQNYPNPFNPITTIKFSIPKSTIKSMVRLFVYDILGNELAILTNDLFSPGDYEVTFDGSSFSSGIYLYKLQVDDCVLTKRMILLK